MTENKKIFKRVHEELITEENLGWAKTKQVTNSTVKANLANDVKAVEKIFNDDNTSFDILKKFMDSCLYGTKIN